MRLTLDTIKKEASSIAVYSRGLDYMKKNRVKKASYAEYDDSWAVKALVSGGSLYEVEVTIDSEGSIEDFSCTCEAYESYDGLCKHCVAALVYAHYTLSQQGKLENGSKKGPAAVSRSGAQAQSRSGSAYINTAQKAPPAPPRMRTDSMARSLLSAFAARDTALAGDAHDVLFVPTLEVGNFTHGIALTFTVGTERQYIVKNLRGFINNIENKNRVAYGKELAFTHSLNAFEPESRRLVGFVKKWLHECRIASQGGYRYYSGYYGNDERRMLLSPDALEEFFDTFCGQTFNSNAPRNAPLTLTDERPDIFIDTEFMPDRGMKLLYSGCGKTHISHHIYILQEIITDKNKVEKRLISRCDTDRSDAISDLMKALLMNKGVLNFAEEDISAFCSSVLPEIETHITLADSEGRLKNYQPEEMTPHIFLDAPGRSKITGLPAAEYGGDMIGILNGILVNISENEAAASDSKALLNNELNNKHRRDAQAENRFLSLLGSCMDFKNTWSPSGLTLEGDDAVYQMLTEGIDKLRNIAVVHISDRLKRYALNPPFKANVGVSLDGGLLKMDLDTGGLPLEQLADILSAYREKRKYYRLKDGSFLRLADGALDEFAQLAEGLQLTDRQLSSGQITVPAFRTLYLDGLFNDSSSGLTLSRNEAFGKLARSMRDFGKNDYEIPETLQGIMRPYQETGYRWLRSLEACSFCGILADDMGLGKSLQLISLFLNRHNTLRREANTDNSSLPSLIVCPASLILNWKSELNKFAPSLPVRIITGIAAGRRELIAGIEPDEIVITSYDLLKKDIEQYSQKQFHYLAIDEAQYIKNQNTKSAQAVKQIVCRQRFALTGTPIENRLSELWSIFDFLMPGYLYGYTRFRQKFELPIVKNQDENARTQLRRLIAPFVLRRLKTEVLTELPPKVNTVIPVDLDKEQRTLYTAAMTVGLRELKSNEQIPKAKTGEAKMKIFALMTRLRQICCDPSLCYEDYKGESAKLEACMELLSEAKNGGHKALLFSQFTSMLAIIRKRLEDEGISYMVLQGSTPKEKRLEMVERFNEGSTDVFLISLKAGGTGLNLTGANVVIHYDPWWNMAAQEQATDRAHRIGQTQSVQVYKLIAANTIEERILKLQEMKGDLASVIDADGEQPLMNMSVEDMLELLESRQ